MASQDVILADRQAVSWAATATLAWMTWDILIHWDDEAEYIWRRPRLWVKMVYVLLRYLPVLNVGATATMNWSIRWSSGQCLGWLIDQLVMMEIITIVVEVILVMRLYILYNRSKLILSAIILAFIAEIISMVTALALALPKIEFENHCYVLSTPSFYVVYWLSSLVFETFLFFLTLVVFFRNVQREYKTNSVIHVFVRDGTWAFAVIFVALLLNMLMYKLIDNPLAGMGYPWGLSVMSLSGSHVLLNLRRVATPQYPALSEDTIATMQFRQGLHDVSTILETCNALDIANSDAAGLHAQV